MILIPSEMCGWCLDHYEREKNRSKKIKSNLIKKATTLFFICICIVIVI